MIAYKKIDDKFKIWNKKWGAPLGNKGLRWPLQGTRFDVRTKGPFGYQGNNSTREFEYPWSYYEINSLNRPLNIVDVGGSLGGMQFVLSLEGHRVTNIDPGLKAGGLGWNVGASEHEWLSKRLGANVNFVAKTLRDANLPAAESDVVLSISALEHFSAGDLETTASAISRILRPGGLAVLTVDLFLDLHPFTDKVNNQWGKNISIYDLLESADLKLTKGNKSELFGFPEFNPRKILENLPDYLIGDSYPCMAQCFVAQKT